MQALALYIHFPFCLALCPYCDFNVHIKRTISNENFLQAIQREIALCANQLEPRRLTSIFFGGGTPSLMPPKIVEKIITTLAQFFTFDQNIEISLEANPENAKREHFQEFYHAGVNRLSLGVQSLDEHGLKLLGRKHNLRQAYQAIEIAQMIFPSTSFDLIYARPQQNEKNWQRELKQALALFPKHLSLYQLSVHAHTAFAKKIKLGQMTLPSPDLAAQLYQHTQDLCAEAHLGCYEISNHAKKNFEAKHNLSVWRYENYAGLGPGAHGRLQLKKSDFVATLTNREPRTWLHSALHNDFNQHFQTEILTRQTQKKERLIMGLRLTQGIDDALDLVAEYKIKPLVELGLLTFTHQRLAATKKGALVLDKIIEELVA